MSDESAQTGERTEYEVAAYFETYAKDLEEALSNALDETMMARRREHPVVVLGEKLLRSQNIDTAGINLAPGRLDEAEVELRQAFAQATNRNRQLTSEKRGGAESATPSLDESSFASWSLAKWVNSLSLDEVLIEGLRAPLEKEMQSTDNSNPSSYHEVEQEFITGVGNLSSHEPLVKLLRDEKVLEKLAEQLWRGAQRRNNTAAGTGDGGGVGGHASKFFEDGSRALKFGELSSFYHGLDRFLAPPNPNLREAMEMEHCRSVDSKIEFRVPNYLTVTTPQIEFWFVADPSDKRLDELKRSHWPEEQQTGIFPQTATAADGSALPEGVCDMSDDCAAGAPAGAPMAAKEPWVRKARKANPPSFFEAMLNENNDKLREKGFASLNEEEFVGGRLYTGPMYAKYNAVLRDIGSINMERERELSGNELSDTLQRWQSDHPNEQAASDLEKMAHRTEGNLYTTSLHVINSCVLKLGNLSQACTVYRGLSRRSMPESLKYKDSASNTRGGVEFGFTSGSREKSEALKYAASAGSENVTPILLEIQQGMVDRGADLTWLSQYEHEREVLFPPLTGIEFLHHHVEDGHVLVVTVRPSVNLRSLTIEKVIAKMQNSHEQLLDLLTDGLRYAGVPQTALQPLTNLKARAMQRDAMWYNSTSNYKIATLQALDKQIAVFESLTSDNMESALAEMGADKLKATAEIAARAGEHDIATQLLLSRRKLQRSEEQRSEEHLPHRPPSREGTVEALEAISKELLSERVMQPWPPTLIALASQRTFGLKDACLPADRFRSLVQRALDEPDTVPFYSGARLLVCLTPQAFWTPARLREIPTPSTPKRGKDGKIKHSGVNYIVEVNGRVEALTLPEEQVIAPTLHGVPAVLYTAAEMGDAVLVRALLDAKASVYATDMEASTALIRAADATQVDEDGSGHHEVIKLLVGQHSTQFFELRNQRRQNAFDAAVAHRSYVALREMQKNSHPSDAEVDAEDAQLYAANPTKWSHDEVSWKNGVTTLMLACRYHSKDVRLAAIRVLLSARADVDAFTPKTRSTALIMAVEDRCDEVVEVLLEYGANPNWIDDSKRTPLLYAAQSGSLEVAQLLVDKKADVMYKRRSERSILTFAAQYGYHRMVDLIIKATPADKVLEMINMTNEVNEESALTFAARNGHTSTCHLLINAGINLTHEVSRRYWTSLHRACANGHSATARLLLEKEPRLLNHADPHGFTALMAAAFAGYTDTVMVLVQTKGIRCDAQNDDHQPALWLAAAMGHEDSVRVLSRVESPGLDLVVPAEVIDGASHVPEQSHHGTPGKKSQSRFYLAVPQPATALMAAAYFGRTGCVRALAHARADVAPAPFNEVKYVHDDALLIGARNGHLGIVRFLMGWGVGSNSKSSSGGSVRRKREAEAEQLALKIADEATDQDRQDRFKQIAGYFGRKRLMRHRSHTAVNKQKGEQVAVQVAETILFDRLRGELASTNWIKEKAYDGMIVPPRPTQEQITARGTPLGSLVEDSGVIIQRGPFNSIWLRAGCIPNTPWHSLWRKLTQYVKVSLEDERKKSRPGAIYVAISLRSMQAIDFAWLADHGFRFHHFRAANRDKVKPKGAKGNAPDSLPLMRATTAKWDEEAYLSEFVYYCWPHRDPSTDMVPPFATSIEGVTGLIFSEDTERVLLVWERRAWSTPGGAVNEGESLLTALRREVGEEVSLKLDPEWSGMAYLGGWQDQKARDNFVNDNFSAFSMRALSDSFQTDGKEISHAMWLPWKPMLEAWIEMGRPIEKRVNLPNVRAVPGQATLPEGRQTVLANVLNWLDTWHQGKGFRVNESTKQQGPYTVSKLMFNSRF